MSNNNFQVQPRRKIMTNDYRLPHPKTDAPLEGGKYPATIFFDITNSGKIEFKVNDGIYDQNNKNSYKNKSVQLERDDRDMIFSLIKDATINPNFTTSQYTVRKRDFVFSGGRGQMSESPIVKAKFTVSKNNEGVIYLTFSKGDYHAKFSFRSPFDSIISVKSEDGFKPDVALTSRMYANAWCNNTQPYLNKLEEDNYQPPKPKENSGNGNNGGGNRGYNNNNDNNDFDDDIDF